MGQKTVPLLQIVTAVYDDEERRTVYQSVRCFFSGVRLVYLIYLRDWCITFLSQLNILCTGKARLLKIAVYTLRITITAILAVLQQPTGFHRSILCVARSQVASGTHAGIYLRPADIGCQYSRSIYTLRASPCGMATSSCRGHVDELATERFLLLHREHGTGYGPTELKLLRSTDLFCRDLKTFLFHSVYRHQYTD